MGCRINGKVAKAASTVAIDQALELRFGNRRLVVQILKLPTRALGNQTEALEYIRTLTDESARYSTLPVDGDDDPS